MLWLGSRYQQRGLFFLLLSHGAKHTLTQLLLAHSFGVLPHSKEHSLGGAQVGVAGRWLFFVNGFHLIRLTHSLENAVHDALLSRHAHHRLRAARLRMYAALKERAAANVSAEEQRFAHWAATNATSNAFAHAAAASIRTSSGGGGAEAADEAELETPATVATAERGGEEIVPVADDGEGEGEGARSRGGDGDDDGATREDD